MVVGPRGIGKTTLVRRVAAEIRSDPELKELWYPLIFAEEAYEIGSPGEFWLEAVFRLADQNKEPRWIKTYEDLKKEPNEALLRERSLMQLKDFADEQGKRLLLIVENFNILLGEQMEEYDDWDLRHSLLNEPHLMLIATATSRFDEIKNINKAMFELFQIIDLKPLNTGEIATLWHSLTGEQPTLVKVRPIHILTGGNPRLLRILADFAAKTSFRELMENLIHLMDEHTEYFKSQLDTLAPKERKVFVALLELWDPANARTIANSARLDVNKTSSLLGRLVKRGAVTTIEDQGRKQLYQVSERLYNIYYLMRRRGHPSNRVRAVVRFMVQFYQGDQLVKTTTKLAEEACILDAERRQDHYYAYDEIVKQVSEDDTRTKIITGTPYAFFRMDDIPESIRRHAQVRLLAEQEMVSTTESEGEIVEDSTPRQARYWIKRGDEQRENNEDTNQVEETYRKAIEVEPDADFAWVKLGRFLLHQTQYEEAEQCLNRHAIELNDHNSDAWRFLGRLLEKFPSPISGGRTSLPTSSLYRTH